MKGINLSEWALKHPQMIAFLLLLLSVAGVLAYRSLGQKEDPDFTIKTMVVQAYWPGSSAQQMADQVTDKLEKKLQEVAEIDYTSSYVKPGETQIKVKLREDMPPRAVPEVWYQVRKKIGDIRHTLPQGAQGPFFNDEFGDTFGNLYAITGDGFDYADLRRFADAARNEFLRVADVNKVDLRRRAGREDLRRDVHCQAGLAGPGPGADRVDAGADQCRCRRRHRGDHGERVRLAVSGDFDSVESIRDIGIRAGQRTFRLGDIAEVSRGFVDPAVSKMRFNGKEAIGLAVSMRKGGDVIRLGEQLDAGRAPHPVQAAGRRGDPRGHRPAARGRTLGASSSCRAWPRRWSSCWRSASSRWACAPAWWSRCASRWCWR